MLVAIRESGPIAARQVTVLRLAQGAAFDISGDVALNTTHREGDGSDHANVALNDTHRNGDGSDHSDVALNSAFIDTEGYNNNPLKAVLDLADIISIETSTGGVFSKVKATLQILKDLIGGGAGGGAEWTEIARVTVTVPAPSVNFLDVFTDTYDTYRVRIVGGSVSGGAVFRINLGYGVGPTWLASGWHWHSRKTRSNSAAYSATVGTNLAYVNLTTILNSTADQVFTNMELNNLRVANSYKFMAMEKGVASETNSATMYAIDYAAYNTDVANKMDHLSIFLSGNNVNGGTFVVEGKNA